MRLDPPQVMLEASFLAAVADPSDPHHAECTATYAALLDDVERGRVLLVAVADHLRRHLPLLPTPFARRVLAVVRRAMRPTGLFAPVHPLHVAGQHRRAARRSTAESSDVAITLVMCERHHIRRIATTDPVFGRYHLDLETADQTAR